MQHTIATEFLVNFGSLALLTIVFIGVVIGLINLIGWRYPIEH